MLDRVANLSIKQMRAVQAVAISSSFLAASIELRMSQPGVSRLVRSTEDELGVQLFQRTTRQVMLTNEGFAFLPAIDRILAEFDLSVANLTAMRFKQKGHVVIACPVSIANHILAQIIGRFRKEHPQVTVEVRESLRAQVVHQVRYGIVDFGIASFMESDEDLIVKELCEVSYHVIFQEDHPFHKRETVRMSDLRGVPLISLPPSSILRHTFDSAATRKGFQLNHVVTVNSNGTMFELVRRGEGVAIQNSWAIASHLGEGIKARPLISPKITSQAAIIRKKSHDLGPPARAFKEALEDHFAGPAPKKL